MASAINIVLNAVDNYSQTLTGLNQGFELVSKSITIMTSVAEFAFDAVKKIGEVGYDIVESFAGVGNQFEQIGVRMEAVFGGSGPAQQALDWATEFSTRTPYALTEIGNSMIKLKNAGIDPMNGSLQAVGDTASQMGRSLDEIIEPLSKIALTGKVDAEVINTLNQKGIKATQALREAYNLTAEQAKDIGKQALDADEVIKILIERMTKDYGGGMQKLSDTVEGAWSTIYDSIVGVQKQILDAGGWDVYREQVLAIRDALQETFSDPTVINAVKKIGEVVKSVVDGISEAISMFTLNEMQDLAISMRETQDIFQAAADNSLIASAMGLDQKTANILAKGAGAVAVISQKLTDTLVKQDHERRELQIKAEEDAKEHAKALADNLKIDSSAIKASFQDPIDDVMQASLDSMREMVRDNPIQALVLGVSDETIFGMQASFDFAKNAIAEFSGFIEEQFDKISGFEDKQLITEDVIGVTPDMLKDIASGFADATIGATNLDAIVSSFDFGKSLKVPISAAQQKQQDLVDQVKDTSQSLTDLKKEEKAAKKAADKEAKEVAKIERERLEDIKRRNKEVHEANMAAIKDIKDANKELYDAQMANIKKDEDALKEIRDTQKEINDNEKDALNDKRDNEKQRNDDEKDALNDKREAFKQQNDDEKDLLKEKRDNVRDIYERDVDVIKKKIDEIKTKYDKEEDALKLTKAKSKKYFDDAAAWFKNRKKNDDELYNKEKDALDEANNKRKEASDIAIEKARDAADLDRETRDDKVDAARDKAELDTDKFEDIIDSLKDKLDAISDDETLTRAQKDEQSAPLEAELKATKKLLDARKDALEDELDAINDTSEAVQRKLKDELETLSDIAKEKKKAYDKELKRIKAEDAARDADYKKKFDANAANEKAAAVEQARVLADIKKREAAERKIEDDKLKVLADKEKASKNAYDLDIKRIQDKQDKQDKIDKAALKVIEDRAEKEEKIHKAALRVIEDRSDLEGDAHKEAMKNIEEREKAEKKAHAANLKHTDELTKYYTDANKEAQKNVETLLRDLRRTGKPATAKDIGEEVGKAVGSALEKAEQAKNEKTKDEKDKTYMDPTQILTALVKLLQDSLINAAQGEPTPFTYT